ncbi:2-succinyl-6-hydroxy-2,4-cyclohexadiene-1-carboxylate synthase [Klebsiella sp. WOUb02]|uniref:2-succinyl-6-hydroxy-2, 4-cyclohexadiene-1-carboxylate synthase n=1 Tax=Klebsiella sp. WOUb02 TaxID=3161071 RepID=UPI003CEC5EAE
MSLHAECERGQGSEPWLIFLHGFSGDSREWQPVGEAFSARSRLYIDLPGHGGSRDIQVTDFADVCRLLQETLDSYSILNYWLIGYSLGGRIAMVFASQPRDGLCGLVVEGGHPGLRDDSERLLRRRSDAAWADRFRREPLPRVFADWYQQPVFASLDAQQRAALIALRSRNHGENLAAMLEATSLAVQPDLRPALRACRFPFHYLCGARDDKFRALAGDLAATIHVIHHAGHNAHRENPAAVAACLAQFLAS